MVRKSDRKVPVDDGRVSVELQRLVAVDWSGDKGPGQRKKIWAGVWTRHPSGKVANGKVLLEDGRSREELTAWLIALAAETPRMVVSLDCCFSYPAWFLAEHGCATVFDFWRHVAAGYGEQWLGTTCAGADRDLRFWGRPHKRPEQFCGTGYRSMMRHTDWRTRWSRLLKEATPCALRRCRASRRNHRSRLAEAGASVRGRCGRCPPCCGCTMRGSGCGRSRMPALGSKPLLVEMYTRLLTGPVKKSNAEARRTYLAARRSADPGFYASLPRAIVAKARSSEDAFDALVCCLEMVRHQAEFESLRATAEPTLRLEGITWRPGVQP